VKSMDLYHGYFKNWQTFLSFNLRCFVHVTLSPLLNMLFVSTRQGGPVPLTNSQTWPQLLSVLNYLYFVIQNITFRFANVSKPHTVFGTLSVRLYRLLSQSPTFSGNNNNDINFFTSRSCLHLTCIFPQRENSQTKPYILYV
jgi:hypothetical protein